MTSVDNTTLSSLVDWAGMEETRWGSGSEEGEDDEFTFAHVELVTYRDLMQLVCE